MEIIEKKLASWCFGIFKATVGVLARIIAEDTVWERIMGPLLKWNWLKKWPVTAAAIRYEKRVKAAIETTDAIGLFLSIQHLYPDLNEYGLKTPELNGNGTFIASYREDVHRRCLRVLSRIGKTQEPMSLEQWSETLGHSVNRLNRGAVSASVEVWQATGSGRKEGSSRWPERILKIYGTE